MNYNEMSDFEINKRVAELHFNATKAFKGNDIDESVTVLGEKVYSNFNPCNNPNHAWSIIVENRISISPHSIESEDNWEASVWCSGEWGTVDVWNKNPLRAACIVYLMMQEAKC